MSSLRANTPAVILIGLVLVSICLLVGFALAAGGMVAWRLNAGQVESPGDVQATPILATPVQPALITSTSPPELSPTPALTSTLPLTSTLEVGLEGTAPTSPVVDFTATLPGLEAAGPVSTPSPASTFPPVALDPNCIPFNRPSLRAQVLRVIDGVTIDVSANGVTQTVTYIGAKLLDFSQDPRIWIQMTERNKKLVEGKTVLLIQDRTDITPDNRSPRFVLVGGMFVNLEMIASGYALAASQPPDLSCQELFVEAERRAAAAKDGLWAPQPTPTRILILPPTPTVAAAGPMLITALAKRGTLWQEPEEWVEFRNDSQEPIQLEGWTVQDNERHIFTFPSFVLGSGQYCRVYTNEYHPNSCGFSYESQSPIWNNDVDCAYLKNPYGELISTFCYGYP